MIRNSRQAAETRRKHAELMLAAAAAEPGERAAYHSLAADLAGELAEYVAIRAGRTETFPVCGIDELGDSLVKARLAKGWTQRELADRLGVTEQMVQRDEAHSYEHAGLARLAETADILGYELAGIVRPATAAVPWRGVRARRSAARSMPRAARNPRTMTFSSAS